MPLFTGTPGATLTSNLGTTLTYYVRPGGVEQIVSNSLANPTVVTTLAPHGLTSGDTVFFTASTTSNPLLTASPQQVVTVISPTTFSVPVNCTTGGTAGAYDYAITSIPVTPGAAPLINVGRDHGLRVGDTVTIVASGSTPSLDGAQVVTAIDDPRSFRVLTSAVPTTVAGSLTAAHYSKTIFYSDVFTRAGAGPGGLTLTSVIGTVPNTCAVDLQASIDGTNWFNCIYTALASPQTAIAGTQLTITTATTATYLLPSAMAPGSGGQAWRFFRLKFSSSTNIQIMANIYTAKIDAF